jgi:hypothetical protein
MRIVKSKGSRGQRGTGPFKYFDPVDNHVLWPGMDEALYEFTHQAHGGMQHKLRNAHSSNSEDALTWSCFDTLKHVPGIARREALTDIWELTFGTRDVPPGVLDGKILIGEPYGNSEDTEVDASIEGDGVLVFIEAKLNSPMSAADPAKEKPHNQIERKLRVGLREAETSRRAFYFILLDIAPLDALRTLAPGVKLEEAMAPRRSKKGDFAKSGFAGKWMTAYWFARYKYGHKGSLSPLQKLVNEAGYPELRAKDVAARMGWLTWGDLFKSVLRSTIPRSQ